MGVVEKEKEKETDIQIYRYTALYEVVDTKAVTQDTEKINIQKKKEKKSSFSILQNKGSESETTNKSKRKHNLQK